MIILFLYQCNYWWFVIIFVVVIDGCVVEFYIFDQLRQVLVQFGVVVDFDGQYFFGFEFEFVYVVFIVQVGQVIDLGIYVVVIEIWEVEGCCVFGMEIVLVGDVVVCQLYGGYVCFFLVCLFVVFVVFGVGDEVQFGQFCILCG